NGEKTGWFYIVVPQAAAMQIKPGNRKFFRARGTINGQSFSGLSLMPAGEGDFILPVNAVMRRRLKVGIGDVLHLSLEEDTDFKIDIPADLEICLSEDPRLIETFLNFSKAHRHYFINWINGARTEPTRTKRIALTMEAMDLGLDFGAMIRRDKARRQNG
ncbi:MAG TPA: YdeI/OmpD-associated family protein, partial [Anseongella sp.]|nr:YdeI/OmpD-associated family protein [Anseongella sp.]